MKLLKWQLMLFINAYYSGMLWYMFFMSIQDNNSNDDTFLNYELFPSGRSIDSLEKSK